MSSTERFVTRREAARICGCSYDSIRRRQADGAYPNAQEHDGAWVIPMSDLVAAGDLDPSASTEPARNDSETGDADAVRIARLEAELAWAQAEIGFQRSLLMEMAARNREAA
ncbi:MAG: hypothetical protein KC461_14110 [Dehalococcoidia bacterium]|nr:hypothetical protein [Dehalococcoidia bacterium]